MEIKLTDDQVKAAVAGAIASLMTGEQRAALVEKAIAGLLTEPYREGGSSYGRETTRMQAIFRDALIAFAKQEIDRLVAEDPTIRESFASVVRGGVEKALSAEARPALVEAIRGSITAVFEKAARY